MINLADIIYEQIKPIIESWTAQDIYAISFFIYDDEDNEIKPTLTVGYNTETFYKKTTDYSTDADEARWNYAFWPQNQEYQFGYDESADVIQKWIQENNYESHIDNEPKYDEQYRYIGKGPYITQKFVEQLILVSQRMHSDNVIMQKFNKSIPILIHELEYYDAIANQTKAANPIGVADNFVNWILSLAL